MGMLSWRPLSRPVVVRFWGKVLYLKCISFQVKGRLVTYKYMVHHMFLSSAGCYLFVSHTGFGGVAYAMAIICIRTGAETNSLPKDPQPLVRMNLLCTPKEDLPSRASDEEALGMGDYRDILSPTRVLVYGPKSKADIDIVIERCAGAWHL